MVEIIEANDDNRSEWQGFIKSRPETHLYHDYRWRGVIKDSFGHEPFYLVARNESGVAGVFPLFFMKSRIMASALISLPFLNYGGPVVNDPEIALKLIEKAREIIGEAGASYMELRNQSKFEGLISREHKVTMLLPLLSDVDKQWASLDAKVRNQIRKAEKSGLKIDSSSRLNCGGTQNDGLRQSEYLDRFYAIFCRNMRDLGTPVLSKRFFRNILKYFPEESGIFIVNIGDKDIGAGFTLSHNGVIEIPWASSLREYSKLCINEFMYWEMIKHGISSGMKKFDFGRCTKGSGTYRFKKQWAPEEKQLYWQYWAPKDSDLPSEDPKGSKAGLINIWKRLPLFLANSAGPVIAREITTF